MNDLKPCPFCGSAPTLCPGAYDYDGGDRWYYYSATIECFCGLSYSVSNNKPKSYCSESKALDFAVDAWNTRACEPAQVNISAESAQVAIPAGSTQVAIPAGCDVRIAVNRPPLKCPKCGHDLFKGVDPWPSR